MTPDALAVALELTPAQIESRLARLALDPRERALLRSLHAPESLPAFVDGLYEKLLATPATAAWLPSGKSLDRLKSLQARYLHALFTGPLDWAHALEMLRIGAAHHRVRLPPQWYIATCGCIVIEQVRPLLLRAPSIGAGVAAVAALLKSVIFDAVLVLDAYGMSLERSLRTRPEDPPSSAPTSRPSEDASSPRAPQAVARLHQSVDDASPRRAFLGLDGAAIARLHDLRGTLADAAPEMLAAFYEQLGAWPETRDLVPPAAVARLRRQVAAYWSELGTSEFGLAHAASRARIGVIHEKLSVAPQHYLIGLAWQLGALLPAVAQRPAPAEDLAALLRAVFFDVSFVVDAYMDARAEAVLRDEGYANQLLGCVTTGVAVLDAHLRVRSTNAALLSILGVEAGLVRHMPLAHMLPAPELLALALRARDDQDFRGSATATVAGRALRVTAMRLRPPDGHRAERAVALVVDDVSDLVALSRGVERVGRNFKELVDAAAVMVWEADPVTWTLRMVSPGALSLTGLRDVELLGRARAWPDRIPTPDRARFLSRCEGLPAGGEFSLEHRVARADGVTGWARTTVRRVVDPGGAAVLSGVTVDLTETHREVERGREAVRRVAGGIAHELNSLLTAIGGHLELLADDASRGPAALAREDLAAAAEATGRVAGLTRRLGAFAQGQILRVRETRLNELVREALPRLAARLSSGVSIAFTPAEDLWRCRVDPDQLEDSLGELLRNAAESAVTPLTIEVETRNLPAAEAGHSDGPAEDCVEVAVLDRGAGISDEVLGRAFDPFFSTREGHVGLGLSVVEGFARQSGGGTRLERRAGGGVAVRVHLPRAAEARPLPSPSLLPVRRTGAVLVIDDDAAIRNVMARALRAMGYAPRTAANGVEALAALADGPVDLVIADIVLSAEDGVTLGREIRRLYPGTPVAFMSGFASRELASSIAAGERFLPKPFSMARLRDFVREVLEAEARGGRPAG